MTDEIKPPVEESKPSSQDDSQVDSAEQFPTASRQDLQLGRRLFHLSSGVFIATLYGLFLSHNEAVYILGAGAIGSIIFAEVSKMFK